MCDLKLARGIFLTNMVGLTAQPPKPVTSAMNFKLSTSVQFTACSLIVDFGLENLLWGSWTGLQEGVIRSLPEPENIFKDLL